MEVTSAVASVVGILGFTGQAISGIIKLQKLFQDAAGASKSVRCFLRDSNRLIRTLEEIKELTSQLEALSGPTAEANLASLKIQLEDCSKDVYNWVREADKANPSSSSGTKAAFKKLLLAINKDQNDTIYNRIAMHQQDINTKLSIIGRSFDVQHTITLSGMSTDIVHLMEGDKLTQAKLSLLDNNMVSGLASVESSLSDRLSRIEAALASASLWNNGEPSFSHSRHGSMVSRGSNKSIRSTFDTELDSDTKKMIADIIARGRHETDTYDDTISTKLKIITMEMHEGEYRIKPDSDAGSSKFHGRPYGVKSVLSNQADTTGMEGTFSRQMDIQATAGNIQHSDPSISESAPSEEEEIAHLSPPEPEFGQGNAENVDLDWRPPRSPSPAAERASTMITMYMEMLHCRAHLRLTRAMARELGCYFRGPARAEEDQKVELDLRELARSIAILRADCFVEGYNLDQIDAYIATFNGYRSSTDSQVSHSNKDAESTGDYPNPAIGKVMTGPVGSWAVNLDSINSWMLQTLRASDEAMKTHKSFLKQEGISNSSILEDDKEWGREVLKYWLLDNAASVPQGSVLSTIGAVDSQGLRNEERVELDPRSVV